MTDIKPCAVKGCKFTGYHHHATANNTYHREGAASQCLLNCGRQGGDRGWTATVAPRLTRKALNARIAALEAENSDLIKRGWADEKVICDLRAENADLFAEIADKKDRLARCEKDDPDAAVVEAMSAAMYAARCEVGRAEYPEAAPWEECTARTRDTYRASARAALKAARGAGVL